MNQLIPRPLHMTYSDQHQIDVLHTDEPNSILIVENNPDHWTLMRLALQQVMPDITVVWSNDADAARHYLADCLDGQNELPRLVVMDIYLPQRDSGLDLLRQLKEPGSLYSHLPIIVFSFSTLPKDIMDAYERGVNAYTIKSPDYRQWLDYFNRLHNYWLEAVALPTLS